MMSTKIGELNFKLNFICHFQCGTRVNINFFSDMYIHIYHADHRKSINLDLNSSYENNKNN